jgi:hypothetical protein
MLFGDFLPEVNPNFERLALLDAMLLDFKAAFPGIHFELRLDRTVINAQAILLNEKRCVLIYGGLALHPRLAENSLTFIFLHETGHHLAAGPRLPFNLSLACDCVADSWAAGEGSDILNRKTGRQLRIETALNELGYLMNGQQEPEFSSAEKYLPKCWNHVWSLRSNALSAARAPISNSGCELITAK